VRLVSVAGCPTSINQVSALLTDATGGLAEAVRSGLVISSGDAVSFRHDLVRDAVYAAIPAQRARCLHRDLAEYHLGVSGTPLAAAVHARTAASPGDLESALTLISVAEALADLSAEDAGELAALAFRTVRAAQPQWLELGLRCLAVLCRTQRTTEAITVADLILARVDDGDVAGQVESQAARALWLSGRVRELTARADRVLRLGDLAPGVMARLLGARALAATRTQAGDLAAAQAEIAARLAREADDPDALVLALQAAGEAARNEGRHYDALASFPRPARAHWRLRCRRDHRAAVP